MVVANANDVIRDKILHWFYDRNSNCTSHRGKNGSAAKISDVKKGLKADYSLSQSQVTSNLTYLVDKGWINRNEVEKQISTPRGTRIPSSQVWYEISSAGIDKIEGESVFRDTGKYAGINIHAAGSNVIQLGDGNIVNANHADLCKQLNDVKQLVVESSLSDEEKLDAVVDIESIKDQLAKSNPDATIIGRLWDRITEVATVGGFASVVERVVPYIRPLITGE